MNLDAKASRCLGMLSCNTIVLVRVQYIPKKNVIRDEIASRIGIIFYLSGMDRNRKVSQVMLAKFSIFSILILNNASTEFLSHQLTFFDLYDINSIEINLMKKQKQRKIHI